MEPATRKGLHARTTFEISETNWNIPNRAHPDLAAVFDLPPQLQPFQVGRVEAVGPTHELGSGACRSRRENVSSGQPRVERTRVETTRSRARTPKSDIVRSYVGRHNLRRAPGGGHRMDGSARIGAVGPISQVIWSS